MQLKEPAVIQLRLDRCAWCNEPLPKGRSDQRTHTQCRGKLFRWRKKVTARQKEALRAIEAISWQMDYELTFADGVEALKSISKAISDVYEKHNIVRVK